MPTISSADLAAISPEIIVLCSAMAVLILGLFVKREWRFLLGYLSVAGLAFAADRTWAMRNVVHSAFSGMFILDGYATYFKMIFYVAAAIAVLISITYVKTEKVEKGEYYSLMLFSTAGMMVIASVLASTGLFEWLAIRSLRPSRGETARAMTSGNCPR